MSGNRINASRSFNFFFFLKEQSRLATFFFFLFSFFLFPFFFILANRVSSQRFLKNLTDEDDSRRVISRVNKSWHRFKLSTLENFCHEIGIDSSGKVAYINRERNRNDKSQYWKQYWNFGTHFSLD